MKSDSEIVSVHSADKSGSVSLYEQQAAVRCAVILNKGSGTIKELLEDERFEEELRNRLSANGWDAEMHVVAGEEIDDTVENCLSKGFKHVIAGGGDGTTSSIAKRLMGTDVALGILPFGTLNLAARDLETPLEPLEAVESLRPGRTRKIDVLEVGDRICLCVTVIGAYTKLLRAGNEFHGSNWWRKFSNLSVGFVRCFLSSPPMELDLETEDGERKQLRTRLMFVLPGGFDDSWGLLPRRESLEVGHCKALVSKHLSLVGLAKLILRFVTGRAIQDPDLEAFDAERIELEVKHRRKVWLAIDGELSRQELPVTFNLRKKSLRVIDPVCSE